MGSERVILEEKNGSQPVPATGLVHYSDGRWRVAWLPGRIRATQRRKAGAEGLVLLPSNSGLSPKALQAMNFLGP